MPRLAWVAAGLLVLSGTASALGGGERDPDFEIARRHFERGGELYLASRYEEAIAEFEAARQIKPLPAFDYNIARCNDRLERFDEAIKGYEQYLKSKPTPDDTGEVRARIDALRGRVHHHPAPYAVGALSLGAAAVGAGLLISVSVSYGNLFSTCGGMTNKGCTDAQVAPLQQRDYAGKALLGIAGAGALITTVLAILDYRRHHRRAR